MNLMLLPLRRYADFEGRSRRSEYWLFQLFTWIVYAALFAGAFAVAGTRDLMDGGPGFSSSILPWGLAALVFALATLIPNIAVTVRRLHDRDMSGWWYPGLVVASLVPFVGFVASIALFVLMLLPGTDGDNEYGHDPRGDISVEVFE